MGSNPSSPILVLDVPPLQGLHRCGALGLLEDPGLRVLVPGAVAAETARARDVEGAERVPDLAAHPGLAIVTLADDALAAEGAGFAREHRGVSLLAWKGRTLGRPALEAILLALGTGGRLAMEDAKGARAARAAGIVVVGVAAILVELERAGRIDDADARARAVLATGYHSRELEWLARRAWP